MERQLKMNDFAVMAIVFGILSIVCSCLSLVNMITIVVTYQLVQEAKDKGVSHYIGVIITLLNQISVVLTIIFTFAYWIIFF
jgi:hypothetical protein